LPWGGLQTEFFEQTPEKKTSDEPSTKHGIEPVRLCASLFRARLSLDARSMGRNSKQLKERCMNIRRVALRSATATLLGAGLLSFATVATFAQTKPAGGDKPASNLEIIHEKLKADKKLIVSQYMELTESEAKKFWPVYEEYQKDLQKNNERLLRLLQSYAADYKNKSLTDEKAKTLLDEWIAFEQDEAKRRRDYAPKVLQALPAKKAARYLQIENEYRILLRYEVAGAVPLVQ
jgi:hypothetical protein